MYNTAKLGRGPGYSAKVLCHVCMAFRHFLISLFPLPQPVTRFCINSQPLSPKSTSKKCTYNDLEVYLKARVRCLHSPCIVYNQSTLKMYFCTARCMLRYRYCLSVLWQFPAIVKHTAGPSGWTETTLQSLETGKLWVILLRHRSAPNLLELSVKQ